MRKYLLLASLPFLAGGCIPIEYIGRAAISGRVVDQRGNSIADAHITLRSDRNHHSGEQITTTCDGRFAHPRSPGELSFLPLFIPADFAANGFTLEVSTPDAPPATKHFFAGPYIKPLGLGPDNCVDLGDVRVLKNDETVIRNAH